MAADGQVSFGQLMRTAQREAGLTQEELAERAGLSTRAISDLERGVNRTPRRDTLDLLSDALNLSPDQQRQWEQIRRRTSIRSAPRAPSASAPDAGNLPHPLTTLIGRDATRYHLSEFDRARYEPYMDIIRASLGDDVFAAEWEAGRRMTLEDAVGYALTESTGEESRPPPRRDAVD